MNEDSSNRGQLEYLRLPNRDGASQAGRMLPALDPGYVSVDERTARDLLEFAQKYAQELRYVNPDGTRAETEDHWGGFIGADLDLDEVVAFMREPGRFSPEQASSYTRPHFALFLTFLQLLSHTQGQLNTLTRRHLDFYYQEVLGVTKMAGVPDHVNVLVDLAPRTEQYLLPEGSLLNAGTDSLGLDISYRTDRDIVVNQAQVDRVSSVYIDKRITGVREARERFEGPAGQGIINMLGIALGEPFPGDPLPRYETGEEVNYAYLLVLNRLLVFIRSTLFMDFAEFRSLMGFKLQRDNADSEWAEINGLLEKAARSRPGNRRFRLRPEDPRDFDANLAMAMGGVPDFDGITEVSSVYDLYDQRVRQTVQQFIRTELHFNDIADFIQMMQIKIKIDNEWNEINRILQEAGRRRQSDPEYVLLSEDPTAFNDNLNQALGPLNYSSLPGVASLDDLYQAQLQLERYFYIFAEDFSLFMSVSEAPDSSPQQWNNVYAMFESAHRKKVYASRRAALKKVHEDQGFAAMVEFAVADDINSAGLTPLEQLQENIRNPNYAAKLADVASREETGQVTEHEWAEIYGIIEISQRALRAEPVAQKEEWLSLYPREDATEASVILGMDEDGDHPRWKTFGQFQLPTTRDVLPTGAFGWAISSPLLSLSQGRRTITLTLGFASDQLDAESIGALFPTREEEGNGGAFPFHVEVGTEQGWITPDALNVKIGNYQALSGVTEASREPLPAVQFDLTFGENTPPVTPIPAVDGQVATTWPMLRLMMRQIWQPEDPLGATGRYITHYQHFMPLNLVTAHVKVSVLGLIPLQAQNDDTALDPSKPFEPFGTSAVAGSRFYLGHPELVYKKLDRLKFNLEWLGAPANLATHYAGYPGITADSNFTAKVSLIDNRIELPLNTTAPLFATASRNAEASPPHSFEIANVPNAVQTGRPNYPYDRAAAVNVDDDILRWNRYFQWELNRPDLQIQSYPGVVAQKSIALAAAISNKTDGTTITPGDYQVNPPYTPKIKSLSLDYESSVEVVLEQYDTGIRSEKIFHIQPFGYSEVHTNTNGLSCPFLPQYDYEGELYLGIRNARPPQNLSVLMQMAEGSANPDLEPAPVEWSYLSGNQWVSLHNGNILLDTTRGLINSGIIIFNLEPSEPNTLLAGDLYWIRAAVRRGSDSLCDAVDVQTQAVSATFIGQSTGDQVFSPEHLGMPLPENSIADLVAPAPQIRAIRQPYTSFGGKLAEQDATFYTRISERLRHKQRALTMWDYERIVLESFPQIYKVKCLPSDPAHQGGELGCVDIVVIPDIRNMLPFDPFEPKAPADLITNIRENLAGVMPPFAHIRVKNAHFVPVKVRVAVRFRPGYNQGYFKRALNEELNRFLSPWAYGEGADIVIGGRIYGNVIINFLEERPYVDYVTNIKLFSSEDGRNFVMARPTATEGYWVETTQPDGVLVAARQHEIDIIAEEGYQEDAFTGINYMKVELDFIVIG